jgi:DNA-binding response OmpR family regulator
MVCIGAARGHNDRQPHRQLIVTTDRPYLLLVEDEATQRQILTEYLSRQGLRVAAVSNGALMREAIAAEMPQAVLLDIGLPGEDGFVLARWLRERHPGLGIIMVTAASDSVDRIVGLETGADDYVTKPFDPRELLARIKSVLRRTAQASQVRPATPAPASPTARVRLGRCSVDLDRRQLVLDDGSVESLTATEFDLLALFCKHPNRPLTREWLLETTSQRDYDSSDRSIDLRITRLRRKIETQPDNPKFLKTVRGVGYMLALEPS